MPKISTLQPGIKLINTKTGSSLVINRIRGWKLQKIRDRILLRDEYTCQRCGCVSVNLEVDHIIPLHLGGADSDENRQSLCHDCHAIKSAEEERGRAGNNL